MEVETLRETKIRELEESGRSTRQSYAQVYESTAFLTHNNAGSLPGPTKLIFKLVGDKPWFELEILQRLGFAPHEITEYKKRAEDAEFYSWACALFHVDRFPDAPRAMTGPDRTRGHTHRQAWGPTAHP